MQPHIFGGDEDLIRRKIAESAMEDHVIMLGLREDPYPYIAHCDLYVQPSRYEGNSVTVREAQVLAKPVAITRYATSASQLEEGVDGIIVPIYKVEAYLDECVRSILGQTHTNLELILVDDGSPDRSGEMCDAWAARDSRVRVIHKPNGGVSHARNVGLDAARGEYITFIDSDDGVRPGYLENLVQCIEKSCADLVISGFEKVTADGRLVRTVIPRHPGKAVFREQLPYFSAEQRESGIFGYCFAKVFPRTLVRHIRFNEQLRLAEDFDFYLNLYEVIETIFLDDHTDYLYLQEAENSTGNTASEKIDYLAQLRINLHYRSMLQKRGVWEGENKRIVEGRLSDYAFFVLFHTPMPHYRERFYALYELCVAECVPLSGGNMLRKWLFFCLRNRLHHAAKFTMTLYRLVRKRLRR